MLNPLALIVEDQIGLAHLFEHALQAADYRTEKIGDGQAAADRLKEIVPDIVLLDLHLPSLSGAEILRRIRADGRLAKTKVFVASANGTYASHLVAEADLVLNKPIGILQLRDLARRYNAAYTTVH